MNIDRDRAEVLLQLSEGFMVETSIRLNPEHSSYKINNIHLWNRWASQGGGQVSNPDCSVVYRLHKIHRANKNHSAHPVVIFNGFPSAAQYMVLY